MLKAVQDSWLGSENGRDMIWNPSSNLFSSIGGEVYAGGQHWIYVFKDGQRQLAVFGVGMIFTSGLKLKKNAANKGMKCTN